MAQSAYTTGDETNLQLVDISPPPTPSLLIPDGALPGQIYVTMTGNNLEPTVHKLTAVKRPMWLWRQLKNHRGKIKTSLTMGASSVFGAVFYWLLGVLGLTGEGDAVIPGCVNSSLSLF